MNIFFKCFYCGDIVGCKVNGRDVKEREFIRNKEKYRKSMNEALVSKEGTVEVVLDAKCPNCEKLKKEAPDSLDEFNLPGLQLGRN